MSRRITSLDVLGEVRRAMRILRRVERYMLQEERREKRSQEKRAERERAAKTVASFRAEDQP